MQRRCKGMKANEGNEGRRMLRIWFNGEAMLSLREAPDCNPSTIKKKKNQSSSKCNWEMKAEKGGIFPTL